MRIARTMLAAVALLAFAVAQAEAPDLGDLKFKREAQGGMEIPPAVFPHALHRIAYKCAACHDGLYPDEGRIDEGHDGGNPGRQVLWHVPQRQARLCIHIRDLRPLPPGVKVRGRGRTCAWAAFALALFADCSAAQSSVAAEGPAAGTSDAIAANDALAAVAGVGTPDSSAPVPAPTPPSGQNVPPPFAAAPSTFNQLATWMHVESEDTQWLRLGTWDGSLGFTYGGSRQAFSNSNPAASSAGSTNSTTRLLTEYLNIRNDAFSIFDPRFISGSLGVTLGLDQVKQRFDDQEQSQHGNFEGYSFNAVFLGDKALNSRVWADRVQGFSTLPLIGNEKSTTSSFGTALNLLEHSWLRDADILPWFDARLQVYQERVLQQFDYATSTSALEQIQNVVSLDAHNGTETSDLSVALNAIDFDYVNYPTGSYRSHGAGVYYSGDFGPNFNTTWNSAVAYNDRAGDIPLQILTVTESADVHHSADLQSSYAYNLFQQNSDGSNSVNQNASANLSYILWRNLTLSAEAGGTRSQYPSGTVQGANGSLGIDYSRGLPGGGQVFANAQGNYSHISDNLSSGEVPVIDEAQSAPPILGAGNGFALKFPFVIASSIVVVDTRGGALLPTTVNVDYTVTTDGNLTRILVLPTSHVIQANDPLAVSYDYLTPSQASYTNATESITLGTDLGWLGLSYTHTQNTAPDLTVGTVTLAGNSTSDTVTGSLRGNWSEMNANLTANLIHYQSSDLAYNTQSYTAGGGYHPFYAIGLNVIGTWFQTKYTVPLRTSGGSNARIDLDLFAPPGSHNDVLSATVFGVRSKLTDSEFPTQTLNQVGTTLNYSLGKLTFEASAQYGNFTLGSATTKSTQFNLAITRRF